MDQTQRPQPSLAARTAQRLPFFYGWLIILTSFLCVFMMGATSFWALPVFVGPMHDDTGWSHSAIFAGLTVYFLTSAFGALLVGRYLDQPGGARRTLLAGVLINAVALGLLRWAGSSIEFILLYGIIGGAGGSSIRIVQATLLSKWYIHKRGMAIGFAQNGGSVSALIMVPLIALLIDQFGWRDAWTFLGVILLLVLLPLVPFVVRMPEDIGLLPDNGEQPAHRGRETVPERSYHLHEIIHTSRFWLILLAVLVGNYSLQANSVITVPHFEDIGFSTATAASSLSVYGVFSVGARFFWGYFADSRGVRQAIVLQCTFTALSVIAVLAVGSTAMLYIAASLQGMAMSGYPPLQMLVWPEYFGRAYIGSIMGFTLLISTIAGATGPLLSGVLFDATGSYHAALWLLFGTWLTCGLVMLAVRPMTSAGLEGRRDTIAQS